MKHWKSMVVVSVVCLIMSWAFVARAQDIVIGFSGPLSGPAAEYGQDMLYGIDMAVNEINAAGGITVGGKKHLFKLEKLDDKNDPTAAVNNARRFRNSGAIAVYNGVFTTIAAMSKVNEEKGNEFLLMAYTSTPKIGELGNKLLVGITAPDFRVYMQQFIQTAKKKGYQKVAMVVTAGAYGEEWRQTFKKYWEEAGGIVTADKPANYYTETDFSTPISAAMVGNPDVMLIGGPSATTALVIEQARSMGYKGGFILIDQANQDYIARMLRGTKLMGDLIGVGGPTSVSSSGSAQFAAKFTEQYKKMVTWECALNYTATHALARAIAAAGTTTDVYKIREAFDKALAAPMLGDKFPNEIYGITPTGRVLVGASIQTITAGKSDPASVYIWWAKTRKEFNTIKQQTAFKKNELVWQKH